MATIILSGAGRFLAGPLGGAVGAVLGNALDHRLFGSKARQGARLSDLAVQASDYGAVLPRLYGRTRVAGTVIWATDLKETKATTSQGKGRPKADNYSYSASFAVALSAREILRVERIWADGSLLRGAAGDWKRDAVMRVHLGGEWQGPDPLIAAAEGLASCPAYRGLAYAVFENLPLGDFGNRIPQLSFEVVADEGPVSAGALLGGAGGPEFAGYAVAGGRLGDVARAMGQLAPFVVDEDGVRFEPGALFHAAEMARVAGRGATVTRGADGALAARVSIDHADASRDYQAGRQTARRLAGGLADAAIGLPAVMGAGAAKALAENVLARVWRERTRCEVALDWRALTVRPGDLVTLPGDATVWRVIASTIEAMRVRLSLVAHGAANPVAGEADGGRATSEADLVAGETRLVVIDLPPLGAVAETPQVAVLANGSSAGWRRAGLQVSCDGGASRDAIGGTALPATIGTALGVLGAGPACIIDRINHVDVTLAHARLMLEDADADALAGGANLAMLGGEAIQFGRAEPLGGAVWRLSELWRGRCGTEAAIGTHIAGETFAVIEASTVRLLAAEEAVAGAVVEAQGPGDAVPVAITVASAGRALRPLSPVRLMAAALSGGVRVTWTRRSRDGFAWRNGVDVPLAEEREAYLVEASGGGANASAEVALPEYLKTGAAGACRIRRGQACGRFPDHSDHLGRGTKGAQCRRKIGQAGIACRGDSPTDRRARRQSFARDALLRTHRR